MWMGFSGVLPKTSCDLAWSAGWSFWETVESLKDETIVRDSRGLLERSLLWPLNSNSRYNFSPKLTLNIMMYLAYSQKFSCFSPMNTKRNNWG